MSLSQEEKRQLLELARNSIMAKCKDRSHEYNTPTSDALNKKCGAFVSLYKKDNGLAGCIGFIESPDPLYQTIVQAAEGAAFKDPRFNGVREEDLPQLKIEISALTPLETIKNQNDIKIGVHGIFLKKGDYQGLLLPQVATRYGWDAENFLDQTCIKAGLPVGSWKDPEAEIYRFSAEVFSEEEVMSQGTVEEFSNN